MTTLALLETKVAKLTERVLELHGRHNQKKHGARGAAGIARSLEQASISQAEHRRRTQAVFDRYPDGTTVEGWTKQTVAGDAFWIKGNRVVVDPTVEIGAKKASEFTGVDMFNPPARPPSLRKTKKK